MMFNETSASGEIPKVTNNQARSNLGNSRKCENYFVSNCAPSRLELSPPNQSLKLTESTACFFAARKKLFREMATRAARTVYDDLAVRRRSLAPVR
jgi:hypothetical protein